MQTIFFGLFTTHSLTNFSIYCSIFTYLETTEWIFNLSACYNQFPFIFTNTFLDIMHEISFEVDGGREEMGGEKYRKVPSIKGVTNSKKRFFCQKVTVHKHQKSPS